MSEITIDYKDDCLDIIDKVNDALSKHGFQFVDDGLPHDGYCVFRLEPDGPVKVRICCEGEPAEDGTVVEKPSRAQMSAYCDGFRDGADAYGAGGVEIEGL